MAQCHNCGAQVAQGAAACPECGAQFTNNQGHQHQQQQGQGGQAPQQGQPQGQSQGRVQQAQPQQVTDGGDSGAIGALISVLSIIYALLNLVLTAGFLLGASIAGAASQAAQDTGAQAEAAEAAGQAGALATIYGLVFLVLTIGFLAAAIGTFSDADWGWPLMAGVWALNLVFSLVQLLAPAGGGASIDILAIVFLVINVAVLGWVYMNKQHELPIGDSGAQQPIR